MEPTPFQNTREASPNHNHIVLWMHCLKCVKENKGAKIDAGWTKDGFQVWCLRHNINIVHVDFQDARKAADSSGCLDPTHDHAARCELPCCNIHEPGCDCGAEEGKPHERN